MTNSDVVREFEGRFSHRGWLTTDKQFREDIKAFIVEKLNEKENWVKENFRAELKVELLAQPVVDADGNKTWNACVNQLLKLL